MAFRRLLRQNCFTAPAESQIALLSCEIGVCNVKECYQFSLLISLHGDLLSFYISLLTHNNNNQIYIVPYGHNFRGTGSRSDQFSSSLRE